MEQELSSWDLNSWTILVLCNKYVFVFMFFLQMEYFKYIYVSNKVKYASTL